MTENTPENIAENTASDSPPRWSLEALYESSSSPRLRDDMRRVEDDATRFADDYETRIASLAADDPDALAEAIDRYERLADSSGRLSGYADLLRAENYLDDSSAALHGDVSDALTRASLKALFFELELLRLDDALLERAMERSEALGSRRAWLDDLRIERPWQLDAPLERLFREKARVSENWTRLFDETLAAMRFRCGEGEDSALGLEAALSRLGDADATLRRRAAEGLAEGFAERKTAFALILDSLILDKSVSDRWRGFEDAAASRHVSNRVSRREVDALDSAVAEAYPRLSHRYYALKARRMGRESLDHWDRNAPTSSASEAEIPWRRAESIVRDAFADVSPEFSRIVDSFFRERRIDAEPRADKASGAFSHPVSPSARPYVLSSYRGRRRDVITLAHELGHGVHQTLSAPRGALLCGAPITLAETASVFAENLAFRRLLADADDVEVRRALLAEKIEDMLNTVVRQIAFHRFETRLHRSRREGALSHREIAATWMSVQSESLGPSVRLGEGYENFWCYVSHFFHAPFYVYSYAYGHCLANALLDVRDRGGVKEFDSAWRSLLCAGGGTPHRRLLSSFGLDPEESAFWRRGVRFIEEAIDSYAASLESDSVSAHGRG